MKAEHLYKSFGDKSVIEDLSFEALNGITGIFGASGAGKTTLLRIIAGLEKATSGTVSGAGIISFCFQEARLFPWESALSNAAIKEHTPGIARKILTELGLENDLSTKAASLSGGMKKRVALARSLAAPYDTLLLDEPFAGLDGALRSKAFDIIAEYSAGRCVLLVSHDAGIISKAERVIELKRNPR